MIEPIENRRVQKEAEHYGGSEAEHPWPPSFSCTGDGQVT